MWHGDTLQAEMLVATSPDGRTWTTHAVRQFGGDVAAVTAGAGGFAVMGGILDRGTPSAPSDAAPAW